jgi:hypothetical protein
MLVDVTCCRIPWWKIEHFVVRDGGTDGTVGREDTFILI